MLKWIVGILLVLALAIGGSCWLGYRELTSAGPTAAVNVTLTPEQAWAYFTVPDSFRVWQDSAASVSLSRGSTLTVGDTVRVSRRAGREGSSSDMTWILRRAEPYAMLEWEAPDDGNSGPTLQRIDSLVPIGDSLRISSTFAVLGMDSIANSDSIGKVGRSLLSSAGKLMVGAMRLMTQGDLERLRMRVQ